MEELKLYESEYRFMDIIWEKEPIRSMDLAAEAFRRLGWKKSTSYTVLKKLADRGFVKNEQAVVHAVVTREQVQRYESEELLKKNFHNSLPAFLTSFLKDRKLSKEEAEEIMEMIKEASR